MSSVNMDIRRRTTNNACTEMAIADFFHAQNIPDAVVESPEFKRLVRQCRLVDSTFVIPSKKKIGGELLDINFANIKEINKSPAVFGVVIMGDGATIHRMPLLNILAMSGTTPRFECRYIRLYSSHGLGGGRRMQRTLQIFLRPTRLRNTTPIINHQLMDVFYFDGASNVQKAGQVLMAKYPHTFCYHGGKHVVALFFTSLSKIKPIRVNVSRYLFNY